MLLRLGCDSRCAPMSAAGGSRRSARSPSYGGLTMRATEWPVNGLAGSSAHPSGLISVKVVLRIATVASALR